MAEETGRRRGQQEPEPTEEKAKAKRKILKRERVIVLPEQLDGDALDATLKAVAKEVGMRLGALKPTNAWLVVAENEEDSITAAIVAHAGEPGTPTAKPGIWKAVPVRGWGDAVKYEKPPEPKVEASKVKDDD